MSVLYLMVGTVKVRNVPEIEKIVGRFNDEAPSDLSAAILEPNGDGPHDVVDVEFQGCGQMSYSSARDLDNIAKELSRFAVALTFITTECDNEETLLYIGSDENRAAAISQDAREQAGKYINPDILLPDDASMLIQRLIPILTPDQRRRSE